MQECRGPSDTGAQVDAEDEASHRPQNGPKGDDVSPGGMWQEADCQSTSESEEESQSDSDVEDPRDGLKEPSSVSEGPEL